MSTYPGYGYPAGPPGGAGPVGAQPPSVAKAVKLMYAGAVASGLNFIFGLSFHARIREMIIQHSPDLTPQQVNTAVGVSVGAIAIGGLLGVGLWLWMAYANGKGYPWARILSAVFFGFACLGLLGNLAQPNPALTKLVTAIVWAIGLAAIILLFRPDSSAFFAAGQNGGYPVGGYPAGGYPPYPGGPGGPGQYPAPPAYPQYPTGQNPGYQGYPPPPPLPPQGPPAPPAPPAP